MTDLDEKQAGNFVKVIGRIIDDKEVLFYSSPLARAYNTSRIISNSLAESYEILLDPILKEYFYGSWAGLTTVEVKDQKLSKWNSRIKDKWNYVVPGGASYSLEGKC